MTIEALAQELRRAERSFEGRLGEARAIRSARDEARAEVQELEEHLDALEEASGVLLSYADSRQTEVARQIEETVTAGLQAVFGDDMSFHVSTVQRARRTEVDFTVRSIVGDETLETSVMDSRGGGVAAVVGFLLNVVILLLMNDARRVMFRDESFAQVSAEYEPALAEFLKELTERTDVQLVLVTHSHAYDDVADRLYRFSQKDGKTIVQEET